jgi:hypothetical protein
MSKNVYIGGRSLRGLCFVSLLSSKDVLFDQDIHRIEPRAAQSTTPTNFHQSTRKCSNLSDFPEYLMGLPLLCEYM